MTLPRRHLSNALVTMLAAATGRPVGMGQRPVVDGAEPELPYGVVYPQPGSTYEGPPMGADHSEAVWAYQVDSVAKTVEQALAMGDRVLAAMVDRTGGQYDVPLTATGALVVLRRFTDDNGPELTDGLVTLSQRFALHVTRPD